MDVLVVPVGAHQQRIAAEVRQQAQFNLRVVGGKKLVAGRGGEGGADLASQLGPDRNVLQVRIDRRQAARRRRCGLKRRVHARLGIGQQRQRVNVIRFELGEMAILEHQARHIVLLRKLLQHVLRRRDRLSLAANHGRRKTQVRKEHNTKLFRRIDVEALSGQLKDAFAHAFQLGRKAR